MSYDARQLPPQIEGVGLGLRRDFIDEVLLAEQPLAVDFFEVAPENWVKLGGAYGKKLRTLTEQYPFVCHGLSLNLGGFSPLDVDYIKQLKAFFKTHQVRYFTEHLSYCGDQGHLYDLMPIPFTEEAVHHVAERIRITQDILEQEIGIENISFYAQQSNELTEAEFVNAVVETADCGLLFDVNNTYVNAINHRYDAKAFMHSMPSDRMRYFHMAGHFDEADDLKIDTHGADVKKAVWDLLDATYQQHGLVPTLLERDFNIPPIQELMLEVEQIRAAQKAYCEQHTHPEKEVFHVA